MHELSLCQEILNILQTQSVQQSFNKIMHIKLEVGELSCVDPNALAFGFTQIAKDTLAAEAKLDIITVPGRAFCEQCKKEVALSKYLAPCPDCDSWQLQIRSGNELRIKDIEVQ